MYPPNENADLHGIGALKSSDCDQNGLNKASADEERKERIKDAIRDFLANGRSDFNRRRLRARRDAPRKGKK